MEGLREPVVLNLPLAAASGLRGGLAAGVRFHRDVFEGSLEENQLLLSRTAIRSLPLQFGPEGRGTFLSGLIFQGLPASGFS